MKKKYYFLGSALPLLDLKVKNEITYADLVELMRWNLTEEDRNIIHSFKSYIDLKNLKKLWLNEELDPRGNLKEKELREAIFTQDGLPEFVFKFVERFSSDEDKIKNFPYLLTRFFYQMKQYARSDFLRFYFHLEHAIILITTALRAKKTDKNLEEELSYEDKTNFLVKTLLQQQGFEHLELEPGYMKIVELFENNYQDPKNMYLAFLEYRFQQVAAKAEENPFSIDQILGYLVGIMLMEDFFRLNESTGKKILDGILR